MFKFMKRRKKDNKGFTLVELVIVVAILAILVGILAPQYTKYVEKSRKAADASNLENLVTAFKTAASDGDDNIAAGGYKITIYNKVANGTTTTLTGVDVTVNNNNTITQADTNAVNAAISEITKFAGNDWQNTKLKSKKWTGTSSTSTVNAISATLAVANDGSVTVTYDPTNIKDQTNK